MSRRFSFSTIAVVCVSCACGTGSGQSQLAEQIRALNPHVLSEADRESAADMVHRDILRRRLITNQENRAEWQEIDNRADWEFYRDRHIERLRQSLGQFPAEPGELTAHTTGQIEGDGFRIENVVYESRPGNWVCGNLYVPLEPQRSMPGLLIVHSHHTSKTHGELQDMGMTWARAGCLVLVIDQVGYGERRAHPFHGPDDYDGAFRASRQDYYYRYDSGIQLSLAGDSLMGWFVWDLMRGVDLLLSRDGIDPARIIILGSVAGGGDPCAVTAALDTRIDGAVPFNFGGLQPESYPLPENAEETFNFAMSSYWDSTRGLPRTCSDGFFHWTIVGSIAPRPLIYAHEFMWDREHDPVWRRFQRIYGEFYGHPDNLDFAVGIGSVRDSSDVATHCTHIGRYHRQFIHPAFEHWFGIHVEPDDEFSSRISAAELRCVTEEYRERLHPKSLPELASRLGAERITSLRARLAEAPVDFQRSVLQREWRKLLGPVEPTTTEVVSTSTADNDLSAGSVEKLLLRTEEGILVPMLLLTPDLESNRTAPVVIAVSQAGKEAFLTQRTEDLAELLEAGFAICLLDVRETGETRSGTGRGRTSRATNLSVNMQMFGENLVGQHLRDVRSVIAYLRTRDDIDHSRMAVWGDSFVEPNPADADFRVPHGVDRSLRSPEPLGGLLALFTALYEPDVGAIYIHRGLVSYASVLEAPHVYVPHDAIVPQALNAGDLPDIAAILSPTKVCLNSPVDALNRELTDENAYPAGAHITAVTSSGELNPSTWLFEAMQE